MAYKELIVEIKEGYATITLNRPEVLNAISTTLLKEVQKALARLRDDPTAKVVLFRGAGEKAFSAGTDIKETSRLFAAGRVPQMTEVLRSAFALIRHFPKPVVCAVQGYCLGAAVALMVSCDMAIAREDAKFGMPEIDRGLPSIAEAAILPQAIGILRARELVLTGDLWDAYKAESCGLVNEVVPRDKFDQRVEEVVRKLSSKDSIALSVQKDICNKWMTTDLETAIDYSCMAVLRTQGTPGQLEGMRSFLKKK